ncbi:hypothetical protein HPB52_025703 [Rhipicephalus sanguineus]|uniref:Uncharacterized protein n=1 Tax=Rhipicephalus sanguineus TaxID=34632 RepID=A0A9D4YRA1_RHISA|nr:hypothetical protein HPB52_025703 [Rhipicephalus sanguineus]
MPTDAALKRSRTRKFKAKARCSFGSTSSHPSNLPSRMKADLPDLFARLEVQRNGEEGVHRSDDSEDRTKGAASNRCSNEEIVPTAEKAPSEFSHRKERSSAFPPKHRQLQMSTAAAPIRASKRKFVVRAKPSSDSTNSGFGYLPSRVEVNLPELFAHPEMHTRSDDPAGTTEEAASALGSNDEIQANPERTPSHKFEVELTSQSNSPVEESEREDSTRPFVKMQPSSMQRRRYCGRKITFESPHRLPGFILLREDLYTFVYYEEPDGEEYDCGGSSNLQDEADDVAHSTDSDNGGHQYTVSDDCELQRARSSSSSSSCYESAVEEQHEEEKWTQERVLSSIILSSLPLARSTSCATHIRCRSTDRGVGHFSNRGVAVDTTRWRRRRHAGERAAAKSPTQPGRRSTAAEDRTTTQKASSSNTAVHGQAEERTETEEQKPVDKNRAGDEVSPHSHGYRCARGIYHRASDRKTSCRCLQLNQDPGHWNRLTNSSQGRKVTATVLEVPDSEKAANRSTDVEYTRSSQRETAKKY